MKIYTNKHECNGCRACEQSCPVGCIKMEIDKEGFWYPVVDEGKCIECGICKQVCASINNKSTKTMKQCYAVRNLCAETRKKSSSGGVFYELAKAIIQRGGIVFGAVFNEEFMVEHASATTISEMKKMLGSKYVQSDTKDTYTEARQYLEVGEWVLYSGTPCQIAGLLAFLNRDYEKLITVEVICHGVPSPDIWRRYLNYLKGCYSENISNINFRSKAEGWKGYCLDICMTEHRFLERSSDNLYMKGFIQNIFLRPSCYNCRIKSVNTHADITLGDYWGIEKVYPELEDGLGVSAIIVRSEKGRELLRAVSDSFDLFNTEYEKIYTGNSMLEKSVAVSMDRDKFFERLFLSGDVVESIRLSLKKTVLYGNERQAYQYPIILQYLKNKLSRIELQQSILERGWKRVMLYAIGDITDLVLEDLKKNNHEIQMLGICDRNAANYKYKYKGVSVCTINELLKLFEEKECDGVVICNIYREKQIIEELILKEIPMERITSVINLIFQQ